MPKFLPRFDDEMMEEDMRKAPRRLQVPDRTKSDRVPNLPSDTALESNKERQDADMMNVIKNIGKALVPGVGAAMPAIAEEIKKRRGLKVPEFKKGGKVSSASKRADGCAQRGKTRGRMI